MYVAAYALCLRDGCLLLAHLAPTVTDGGKWTLPGGGLEFGEDPAAGVLRELDEETGLAGTITRLAGIYSRTYHPSPQRPWGPVHHLGILYWVEAHPGELRHEAVEQSVGVAHDCRRDMTGTARMCKMPRRSGR
jgi:ADP-ribose pyrophosphatase YjhB (NUDIX family)